MTDSSQLAPGQTLLGKLRVIRLLGEGGMGAVYEVEHSLTRHRRALKVLHPRLSADPAVTSRLLREASVAGTLRTKHVVETFDAGFLESGAAFVLMEMLEGHPLSREMGSGPMPTTRLSWVVAQVCDALSAAHAASIVHRDLKPDNIFIARDRDGAEQVKVLDFGISKFADPALPGSHITQAHTLMGTPQYMSPEQTRSATQVDGRSDTYSLGVLMYEALVGAPPFDAESLPEILVKIHLGKHRPLSEAAPHVPPAYVAIVEKAMAIAAGDRFQSAAALKAALEHGAIPTVVDSGSGRPAVAAPDAVISPTHGAAPSKPTHEEVAPTLHAAVAAPTPLLGGSDPAPNGVSPTLHASAAAPTAANAPPGAPAPAAPGGYGRAAAGGVSPTVQVPVTAPTATPIQPLEAPPTPRAAAVVPAARGVHPAFVAAAVVTALLALAIALGVLAALATSRSRGGSDGDDVVAQSSEPDAGLDAGGPCAELARDACYERGHALELGDSSAGVARDEAQAATYYEVACEAGQSAACTGLGRLHFHGRGVPQDDVRSREFAGRGCDGGDAAGCANLAAFYREGRGGVEQDAGRTFALVAEACERGRADSCFSTGFFYENGGGTAVDLERARQLYRQGCDGGSGLGCTQLGFLMSQGRGGLRSEAGARDYYRRGCLAEHTLGCVNLGAMLLNGRGGSRDQEEAATLFERACGHLGSDGPATVVDGSPLGCANLGKMYEAGAGVPRDLVRARALFEQACVGEHAESCETLARMLGGGRGGPADRDRASELMQRACAAGRASACRAR